MHAVSEPARRALDVVQCDLRIWHSAPRPLLHDRVLGAVAALGERQAAALRRDRTALHAVRWRNLDSHEIALLAFRNRVDLRRAHVHPRLREAAWNVRPDPDVVRSVVARSIA